MKKLLFITKNYPPAVGGMENYCRDLVKYFRKSGIEVVLIANGQGVKGLPWFAIRAFFLGLWYSFQVDAIRIGDGSVSFFGYFLGRIARKPRYVTIHGLDITRKKSLYQKFFPSIIAKANHIVAVSENTKQECVERGIPVEKITVIPNGIDPDRMPIVTLTKDSLLEKYAIPVGKKILFSIGRHVERKGFHWLLEEVMPKLSEEYSYVLAGSGSWTDTYREIIARRGLENVYLIGRIPDEDKYAFYQHSDRFIMPNIEVPGDIEGFGIVCIEAGWYGLPVIASDIDGISDAVVDGESGILISSDDTGVRRVTMQKVSLGGDQIKDLVRNSYSWEFLISIYYSLIK